MRRSWISIISAVVSVVALAGVVALAIAYEKLRRQMAGISSDLARMPNPSASNEHFEARLAVIRSQLSRVEKPIIVMGDSIVESALLPTSICDHPVVNAGIGGATIGFFTRYAEIIAKDANPELVVLSVGINDATANNPAGFRSAYLSTLQSITSPLALVPITPAKALNVDDLNRVIRGLNNYSIIEPGELNKSMTTDGIHLDETGYRIWTKAVVQGIETKVGCSR
jgi:lysophospholipase L1-like esterase